MFEKKKLKFIMQERLGLCFNASWLCECDRTERTLEKCEISLSEKVKQLLVPHNNNNQKKVNNHNNHNIVDKFPPFGCCDLPFGPAQEIKIRCNVTRLNTTTTIS